MSDLLNKKCVPCEGGVGTHLTYQKFTNIKKIDGWKLHNEEKNIFEKNLLLKNFLESQKFVNEVGKISEEEGHHPDITFGWGYAKIDITTHAIKGLSENDFILAAKIDKLLVLKVTVFEKTKTLLVLFTKLIISLSRIEPDG